MKVTRYARLALSFGAAASFALSVFSSPALAGNYPDRPINMIVPFPPGGPTDVFARIVAHRLGKELGQPIVVDNRGGAAGNIGAAAAAKTAPDGYNILFGTASIAIAPSMFRTLAYNPLKDLQPVALVGAVPALLLVQPDAPQTVKEFVDLLKKNPGKYSYATSGYGTATHLITEVFNKNAGVETITVPYRGTGPAHQGLRSKAHLYTVETASSAMSLVRTGVMKPIGIASDKRSPLLPNVPTILEAGIPNVVGSTWNMIFVAAGTPGAVVQRLNVAVNKSLEDPETAKKLAELTIDANSDSTPESAKAYLESEIERWKKIVAVSGVAPN